MPATEDIGCNNDTCIKKDECQRQAIYRDGSAREVKTFGGNPQKGCGKFIEKPKKSTIRS